MPGSANRKRAAARLAVVQALYELDVSEASADAVITAFLKDNWLESVSDPGMTAFDAPHFGEVVRAVEARRPALDAAVNAALAAKLQVERLEVLLRSILRAGAYELSARYDIPANVIINEYVEVAHAFFGGKEPALVNAVLDSLAKSMGRGESDGATATRPNDPAESDSDADAGQGSAEAAGQDASGDKRSG
ncbi:MAG: transcription antitermination factor NusB [Rhodospirillales bacterium]|nr:transcription antitermination factor NusB [Rhodospirillales bacterium]